MDLPVRSLVAGDNVLAVEVHQVSATSSDVTMAVQLLSITSNLPRTTIASLSPAPNAVDVPRDTAFDITLGNGTQKVQTESIQLFVNGQSVTPAISPWNGVQQPWTYIHYRSSQILPAETNITVKLVFNDDATPPNITIREFRFTTAPDITVLVALDDQQMWRYDESGQDLGAAWKEKALDDSSWKSGAALFEGKKGTVPALPEPVRTTLTVATNKTTFYFRTHFNFPADPRGTKLKIKCIVDDGAVFYLNGVEVFRIGMPAGPVTASTPASRSIGDAVYEGPFDIPSAALVSGDNVLAVEAHQTSPTSSDITMGVQLFMPGAPIPPSTLPGFTSVALTGTGLKIEWTGSGQLQSADTVIGPWTDVTNVASPFITAPIGTGKFYRLK